MPLTELQVVVEPLILMFQESEVTWSTTTNTNHGGAERDVHRIGRKIVFRICRLKGEKGGTSIGVAAHAYSIAIV